MWIKWNRNRKRKRRFKSFHSKLVIWRRLCRVERSISDFFFWTFPAKTRLESVQRKKCLLFKSILTHKINAYRQISSFKFIQDHFYVQYFWGHKLSKYLLDLNLLYSVHFKHGISLIQLCDKSELFFLGQLNLVQLLPEKNPGTRKYSPEKRTT
jgi:hypothetical protein